MVSMRSLCTCLIFVERVICYQWLEGNHLFDCVVGIMYDNKPISIGTFITSTSIITSANPLQKFWETDPYGVKIYRIKEKFNAQESKYANEIAGDQSSRHLAWVAIGYNDSSHTTIHDIMIINVQFQFHLLSYITFNYRRAFSAYLPKPDAIPKQVGSFYFAGFGYLDMDHVKNNSILDMSYLEKTALADCDEWIPREWGRFICFYDYDDLAGVASGAPLFHSGDWPPTGRSPTLIVYGVGSFSLTKGNETVLVFTDLRPYSGKIHGTSDDAYLNDIS